MMQELYSGLLSSNDIISFSDLHVSQLEFPAMKETVFVRNMTMEIRWIGLEINILQLSRSLPLVGPC